MSHLCIFILEDQVQCLEISYGHKESTLYILIIRWKENQKNALHYMCPYPRLHFLIPSYGLLRSINDDKKKENENEFFRLLIKKDSKLFQCSLNPSYLSTTLIYRSKRRHNIYFRRNEDVISNFQHQFNNNSNLFLCESSNYQVLHELAQLKSTAVFLSNDVLNLIDYMQKRAFVHWFVNEGLESGELTSARRDLIALIKGYQDFANPIDQGYFDEQDY